MRLASLKARYPQEYAELQTEAGGQGKLNKANSYGCSNSSFPRPLLLSLVVGTCHSLLNFRPSRPHTLAVYPAHKGGDSDSWSDSLGEVRYPLFGIIPTSI
jgi:hypothetical protein